MVRARGHGKTAAHSCSPLHGLREFWIGAACIGAGGTSNDVVHDAHTGACAPHGTAHAVQWQ
eukprot:8143211-Lingulodinium_polyedra.AAC.1